MKYEILLCGLPIEDQDIPDIDDINLTVSNSSISRTPPCMIKLAHYSCVSIHELILAMQIVISGSSKTYKLVFLFS